MKRLFVLIVLVFSSCSPALTETPTDDSILVHSTCNLPCWYGIVIGSTTKQELFVILPNIVIVNQDSITVTESVNTIFDERIFFTMGKRPKAFKLDNGDTVEQDYLWSGDIAIQDDKVAQIVLTGDLGITFQQLVDLFGEPAYLIPAYTPGGHIWVEAINPSQGLDFGYRAEDLHSQLTADTPIHQIKLFDAKLYTEMLQNKMFLFSLSISGNIEEYVWKGYGNIGNYWRTE